MDVRAGQVVKGVQFQQLRLAGDPAELAERYNVEGDRRGRHPDRFSRRSRAGRPSRKRSTRSLTAIFLPLDRGRWHPLRRRRGGRGRRRRRQGQPQHRGIEQPRGDYDARPAATAARRSSSPLTPSGEATASPSTCEAARLMRRAMRSDGRARPSRAAPAKFCSTSMDRDGTRSGFDCEMTAAVANAVNIPVIASGGAGGPRPLLRCVHTRPRGCRAGRFNLSLCGYECQRVKALPSREEHPGTHVISVSLSLCASLSGGRALSGPPPTC